MMLARLGLRAGEVATLTLDDINWRSGGYLFAPRVGSGRGCRCLQMLARRSLPICGMAARRRHVADYFYARRRRTSASRPVARLLWSPRSPSIAPASRGYAHQGAHLFRHSLATELLRSGATLSEIGQLLRHESHDTTRIYAKVDIEALRTLSPPWPGGAQ